MNLNNKHLLFGACLSVISMLLASIFNAEHAVIVTLGITALTGYYWITEAIPIPLASLIPMTLFPFFGVLSHKEAASSIGSHIILLLMGAFMMASAIERSGVHKRIAFSMLSVIGGQSAKRIIFAIMVTSASLSMWISNTATVVALLPVVLALCASTDNRRFKIALLLGLAYSASVGGVATIIGTPPNVIFASVYEQFADKEYGFLNWMKSALPIVIVVIPLMALWLSKGVKLNTEIKLPEQGPWQPIEKRVLMVFGFVVFCWIFRKEPFGGWSGLFGLNMIGDSTIAILGVVLMAIVSDGKGGRLLPWAQAQSIPWGILLLFAGGICIAKGFVSSGLTDILGQFFVALGVLPIFLALLLLAIGVSFLTEVTSNTATATLLMPVIASAAIAMELPIELLMIPVVISCSCAFCLPVATGPNSVVFASGEVTIKEMAQQGVILNLIVAFIVAGMSFLILT